MAKRGGRRKGSGRKPKDYPLDIDQYHANELRSESSTELTRRKCKSCNQPIYRKYDLEVCKVSGVVISKICIWDQYYTCSDNCRREWLKSKNSSYLIGNAARVDGVPAWTKIKDPYVEQYRKVYGKKWGNGLHFSVKGRNKHNKEYLEKKKREEANGNS